jgi:hypothetical protein
VGHYRGGIEEWENAGLPVEIAARDTAVPLPAVDVAVPPSPAVPSRVPRIVRLEHGARWGGALLEAIDGLPTSRLFLVWLAMVASCGLVYWIAPVFGRNGLVTNGDLVPADVDGLLMGLYFSFVTATSVGYGDVAPVGFARLFAITEAVAGLLLFGAVISKFVSRRQDELVREIHRTTFEDRLDRVQTNLHLVLSELQSITGVCDEATVPVARIAARLESATLVFAGELRATHDLLYRPHTAPPEPVLSAILATLAGATHALRELLVCLPPDLRRSQTLDETLRMIARLADEVCGECVPHAYTPTLRAWMDRVQEAARGLA